MNSSSSPKTLALAISPRSAFFVSCIAAALAGCGGGASSSNATVASTSAVDSTSEANAAVVVAADPAASAVAAAMATVSAVPTFHMAPAQLAEPADSDAGGTNATAHASAQAFHVDPALGGVDSTRLTPQALATRVASLSGRAYAASVSTAPQAATITGAVYTPAQIRAAYGLADLPATGATVSAAVAATLGAGQTIYVIDAYDNANALSDLNKFSTKFGLPTCTAVALTATSTLPLAAAGSTCAFSVAYATSAGALKSAAPSYNASWASEIALDVQWAHAIAPLARIVLIETADSMTDNLLGGVALANKMGAGVVSMSFGATEGSWVTGTDSSFTTTGMTYLAATGDNGAGVEWPAVSPKVLAVGGTSLAWSGSGTRYEAAWSGSGGGISNYESVPSWQSAVTMPGSGTLARRAVSDVSFNADPMTGQYVAVTAPGSATTSWNAYGGTSIATPQWAGLVAVANAMRVAASKALLGDVHATLYATIAAVPGTYASAFADVVNGNDGSCATCVAATGYDQPTGWGTPNAASLLSVLAGTASAASAAPVVPGGTFSGKAGAAFSQSLGVTAPSGVTVAYSLSGAPSGMTVDSTGTLAWAKSVAGTYTFTATAKTSANQSATGTYVVKIIAGSAPVFSGSTTLTGSTGTAFTSTLTASNPNNGTLTFSTAGAPSGLSTSSAGVLSWAAPVAGKYSLAVTVADNFGYSASRTYTLTVTTVNHAPAMPSGSFTATTLAAFTGIVQGADQDGDALTYTISGAPSGLSLSSAGVLSWAKPVKGSYSFKITAKDPKGLTAVGTWTLAVTTPNVAPSIASGTVSGKAGAALSYQTTAADANGDKITYALSNAPSGMTISAKGVLAWAAPVAGTYAVKVTVTDAGGLSTSATITVAIAAVNHAPVLAAATLSAKAGVAFSGQLAATDADGDAITYTMTGGTSGLTLSSSGALSWAKTVKGSYTLTVTPKDAQGLAGAAATIKLTVA